jgi:hypothetical protein
MQYMENKVVPVLAGVIAYLDTNHNLDLVASSATRSPTLTESPAWLQQVGMNHF